MKAFLNYFRGTLLTNPASANRHLSFRPQFEQLEDRLLLSASSAISIQHHYFYNGHEYTWTEQDWYTVDQNTHQLVEFQGTTRHNLGLPPLGNYILGLSASVDPNTGFGEVFAASVIYWSAIYLCRCDSNGNWHSLRGSPGYFSATQDGHVYAGDSDTGEIYYLDSNGNGPDLGTPNGPTGSLAASHWAGGNEVFAIGANNAIYVNSTNAPGQWQLVDNQANFVSLSATVNNTVFAVTNDGRLFQEIWTRSGIGSYWLNGFFYWSGQDISGGHTWTQISADTDASGLDEVYAINTSGNAYLHDQGSWTFKDGDVYDISAAGGGYFYDVNYHGGNYDAYEFNPYASWTYLGSHLDR